MDEAVGVQVGHSSAAVEAGLQAHRRAPLAVKPLQLRLQIATFAEFNHLWQRSVRLEIREGKRTEVAHHGDGGRSYADPDELHDVGVLQGRGGLRFRDENIDDFLGDLRRGQQLDGHQLALVLPEEHLGRSTLPYQLVQLQESEVDCDVVDLGHPVCPVTRQRLLKDATNTLIEITLHRLKAGSSYPHLHGGPVYVHSALSEVVMDGYTLVVSAQSPPELRVGQ